MSIALTVPDCDNINTDACVCCVCIHVSSTQDVGPVSLLLRE